MIPAVSERTEADMDSTTGARRSCFPGGTIYRPERRIILPIPTQSVPQHPIKITTEKPIVIKTHIKGRG